MKRISSLLIALCVSLVVSAQDKTDKRPVPAVDLKMIDGTTFNSSKLSNNGKPMIIDFWATWCKPCIEELNAIHEVYADWQKETGVKLVAISLDDARTMNRVGPFVNGRNWTYENYVDPNGDFRRALNVNMPPHVFLVDGEGNIVWQHVGYTEGSEDELFEMIKKLSSAEKK